jgi:hypothetical protein
MRPLRWLHKIKKKFGIASNGTVLKINLAVFNLKHADIYGQLYMILFTISATKKTLPLFWNFPENVFIITGGQPKIY